MQLTVNVPDDLISQVFKYNENAPEEQRIKVEEVVRKALESALGL